VGPLEQEIHDMTREDFTPRLGNAGAAKLLVLLLGHFNKL
jgi:hypothetical protein